MVADAVSFTQIQATGISLSHSVSPVFVLSCPCTRCYTSFFVNAVLHCLFWVLLIFDVHFLASKAFPSHPSDCRDLTSRMLRFMYIPRCMASVNPIPSPGLQNFTGCYPQTLSSAYCLSALPEFPSTTMLRNTVVILLMVAISFFSLSSCGQAVRVSDVQVKSPFDYNIASMDPDELESFYSVVEAFIDGPDWRASHPRPCSEDILPGMICEEGDDNLFHVTRLQFGTGISPTCRRNASIPLSITKLPYLEVLLLSECFMTFNTTIPSELEILAPSLQELSIRDNNALVGSIPASLGNLVNLEVLSLSQNKLQGEVPSTLANLTRLQHLDLSYNLLSGTIPEVIGSLSSLSILDLSGNELEGAIPSALGSLNTLQKLDLSSNMLRGKVPVEFGQLQSLRFLTLSNNGLAGPLPESFIELQNIEYFMMDNNQMETPLPNAIGSWTKLKELSLSAAQFVGPIPEVLGSLLNLTVLDLSNNKLADTIPANLQDLSQINSLNLSQNMLSGPIPFSNEFMARLGERLDLHGNPGLCMNDSIDSNTIYVFRSCKSSDFDNSSQAGYGDGSQISAGAPFFLPSDSGGQVIQLACTCNAMHLLAILLFIFL
eukprot:c28432_g2_i1 orf=610-2418(+)